MTTQMDATLIFERVREILERVLALDANQIHSQSTILIELDAESIDILDLRFRLEQTFGIKITDEQLRADYGNLSNNQFIEAFTVGSLCEYVERRLGEPDA